MIIQELNTYVQCVSFKVDELTKSFHTDAV